MRDNRRMPERLDVIVIGAGAAGMFCAARAAERGLRVALVDHWPRLAEKIRISGGGRCNFTNLQAGRIDRFCGEDPAFARHALRALPPSAFIERVKRNRIAFHEKHKGQLFCDDSATRIIDMLRGDCDRAGVRWIRPVRVLAVERRPGEGSGDRASLFLARTDGAGDLLAHQMVIATGGLAIPKVGATDFGLRVARQFGLRVVEPRPALVPLTFDPRHWAGLDALAGLALPVRIRAPNAPEAPVFDEDLLFTHRGLSGPAILQISGWWRPGEALSIDLAAGDDLGARLLVAREGSRQQFSSVLSGLLPRRLAQYWLSRPELASLASRRIAELGGRELAAAAAVLRDWRCLPDGTEGYRKAEVMAGGVATDELDPRSMASSRVPGLHFIGEVVDLTGWLGGYNFQWAWASAWSAAQSFVRVAGARG
jgi:predicted Rossmann fold flavoprotein